MEDDKFNMSLRKFLKHVGVTSQQQIEHFMRGKALTGTLKVRMVLTAQGTGLNHIIGRSNTS